jgi:hypothetical protein
MANAFMTDLESSVKKVAFLIQREMKKPENISRFTLHIEADGRIDGDIKIEYRICVNYESIVCGDSVGPVLTEVMRRKGWDDTHRPVMISHVNGEVVED